MIANIQYILEPQSAFHIGRGFGSGGINRMLFKQANGKFVIPGSTVKGRTRYYCREFAHTTGLFSETEVDIIFGHSTENTRGRKMCAFSDLKPDTKDDKENVVYLQNGIQISRKLGITKPKALFNTEYIKCQQNFCGTIIYQNPNLEDRHIALLVIGLRMLERLGGSRSTGAGKCQIPLQYIQVTYDGSSHNVEELISSCL